MVSLIEWTGNKAGDGYCSVPRMCIAEKLMQKEIRFLAILTLLLNHRGN